MNSKVYSEVYNRYIFASFDDLEMNIVIIPRVALSLADENELSSCIHKRIQFYLKMTGRWEIINGIVWYECLVVVGSGNNVKVNHVKFRYSEFERLYRKLVNKYGLEENLYPYPVKRFWSTSKYVVMERIEAFKQIVPRLNKLRDVIEDEEFRRMFELEFERDEEENEIYDNNHCYKKMSVKAEMYLIPNES